MDSQSEPELSLYFPLKPSFENGFDIALKAYMETFIPENKVKLIIPGQPSQIYQEALNWFKKIWPLDCLPAFEFTEVEEVEANSLLLPYRQTPHPQVLKLLQTYPMFSPLTQSLLHINRSTHEKQWSEIEHQSLKYHLKQLLQSPIPPQKINCHNLLELEKRFKISASIKPATQNIKPAPPPPTISVCMIVKNEENMLPDCLNTLGNDFLELIVVDTGSTDQTLNILKNHPRAKIFEFQWSNDFSQARNFSIKQANGQWILVLDADERLPPDYLKETCSRLSITPDSIDAYVVPILAVNKQNQIEAELSLNVPRIFRNKDEIYYRGLIHECLSSKKSQSLNFGFWPDLPIMHQGYQSDFLKTKNERNLKLMKAILNSDSQNKDHSLFALEIGQYYFKQNDPNLALEYYDIGLKTTSDTQVVKRLKKEKAKVLYDTHQLNACLNQLLSISEPDTETYLFIGNAYHHTNQLKKAEMAYKDALMYWKPPELISNQLNQYIPEHIILEALGALKKQSNHLNEAYYFYKLALKSNPTHSLLRQHVQQLKALIREV